MKNKNNFIIIPKVEPMFNYNLNKTPTIKHFKNDYESIRKQVLDNENNINKIDIENNKESVVKNTINKNIINFKIV